ncbi:MAG: hypothetical protein AAF514_20285 [Verrucomicrobiota bacterium]
MKTIICFFNTLTLSLFLGGTLSAQVDNGLFPDLGFPEVPDLGFPEVPGVDIPDVPGVIAGDAVFIEENGMLVMEAENPHFSL